MADLRIADHAADLVPAGRVGSPDTAALYGDNLVSGVVSAVE